MSESWTTPLQYGAPWGDDAGYCLRCGSHLDDTGKCPICNENDEGDDDA